MSILKAKILIVQKHRQERLCQSTPSSKDCQKNGEETQVIDKCSFSPLISRSQSTSLSSTTCTGSQKKKKLYSNDISTPTNIMKNYCRGMIYFALSDMAIKYLLPLLQKHQIKLETFKAFIKVKKSKINCIKQLRGMLLVTQDDRKEVAALKKIFKEITIIFLKYFSPNWIYNSKITDKYAHLKYRFKILRRVKNQIYFTYLQGFDYNPPLSKPCF